MTKYYIRHLVCPLPSSIVSLKPSQVVRYETQIQNAWINISLHQCWLNFTGLGNPFLCGLGLPCYWSHYVGCWHPTGECLVPSPIPLLLVQLSATMHPSMCWLPAQGRPAAAPGSESADTRALSLSPSLPLSKSLSLLYNIKIQTLKLKAF